MNSFICTNFRFVFDFTHYEGTEFADCIGERAVSNTKTMVLRCFSGINEKQSQETEVGLKHCRLSQGSHFLPVFMQLY